MGGDGVEALEELERTAFVRVGGMDDLRTGRKQRAQGLLGLIGEAEVAALRDGLSLKQFRGSQSL